MIDLSTQDASNKHGKKVKELGDLVTSWINSLSNEYETLKQESDEYSKEIKDIIKNVTGMENGKIELKTNVNDSTYSAVVDELKDVLKEGTGVKVPLELADKENIQIAILQIANRIDEINSRTEKRDVIKTKLEQINTEIDKISNKGVNAPEEDADMETVVELDDYRNKADEEVVIPEGEVEDIHPANDELVSQINESIDESTTPEEATEEPVEEDEDVNFNIDFEDNNLLGDIDTFEPETEEEPEEDSYQTFTLGKAVSLVDISQRVYGDSSYWKDLYAYDTNKDIIDNIADDAGVEPEEICTKKGKLNGVTLKFPLELVTYEGEDNN